MRLGFFHRSIQRRKGEKAWPPLAMFEALLLATWYDLSDVALSEALSDRAGFRRLCGFPAPRRRPSVVRFRRRLVARGLDRNLFAAIARDLESKGACVRKGTSPQSLTAIASLIDAAVIGSASKGDKEAAWVRHRIRPPAHGYSPYCGRQGQRHHPKSRDHTGQRARCLDCSCDHPR
jgi:transposase, IS5 family